MKKKICVWAIGVMLSSLVPLISKAQPYRHLAPRDFAGAPPTDSYFAAYTCCYVHYSYTTTRHNGIYNVGFDVQLEFNGQKSYIRFDQINNNTTLTDILDHEQGHYNIAWLMRNELYTVLSHHHYTANYEYEIASLFRGVDIKYHKMNDDYESQTLHMTNHKNQLKWDTWFNRQLNNSDLAENRSTSNSRVNY